MRTLISAALVSCLLVAGFAATAAPAPGLPGQIVTRSSLYLPGDDSFGTQTLELPAGSSLRFTNLDVGLDGAHSVTSATLVGGIPLFDSGVQSAGGTVDIGISSLPAGTYHFYCLRHGNMNGTLVIF